MSHVAVEAEGLGKRYRIGAQRAGYGTLRESLSKLAKSPLSAAAGLTRRKSAGATDGETNEIWAVRNVSFRVNQGEIVGIVGANGAGKSTLLKMLSKITNPTEGWARINGRVGSLLEVGTGFHPELTGRENVYLNGAIMGMKRAEIDRKFDEIVEFSEIERFIDTPVKRYSSGMYVRLAFAVAAHLEPEVLIVDEVLAVGDYRFQEKCLDRMRETTSEGRTVLFVSHNMRAITQICSRVILFDRGGVIMDAEPASVVRSYTGGDHKDIAEVTWGAERAPGNNTVKMRGIAVVDGDGIASPVFHYTDPVHIRTTFEVLNSRTDLYLRMYLVNEEGIDVFVTTELERTRFSEGIHTATFTIPAHYLNEGSYAVKQMLFKEGSVTSGVDVARVDMAVSFAIDYTGKFTGGIMGRPSGVLRPDWGWEFAAMSERLPSAGN